MLTIYHLFDNLRWRLAKRFPSHSHTIHKCSKRIEGRPYIDTEHRHPVLIITRRVIVNDVPDLPPTPIYSPIMSIKWGLPAVHLCVEPGFWTEISGASHEPFQLRTRTYRLVHGFPLLDFIPYSLVQEIVDLDHGVNVLGCSLEAFTFEGVVEHPW